MKTKSRKLATTTLPPNWDRFAQRLSEALAVLEDDDYLILSHPKTHHFVQFAGGDAEGLLGEAKSNHYIAKSARLDTDKELRLVELGWKAPTHREGEPSVFPGSPNWFRLWDHPADFREAALVAVMTLREVYGVRTPASLRYKAFRAGGGEIRLPTLGVKHDGSRDDSRPPRPEWLRELKQLVSAAVLEQVPWMGMRRLENGDLLTEGPDVTVLVREKDEPFQVLFHAGIAGVDDATPELLAAVNELNCQLLLGQVSWREGWVVLDWMMPASPFHAEQFVDLLVRLHRIVPGVRGKLAEMLEIEEEA